GHRGLVAVIKNVAKDRQVGSTAAIISATDTAGGIWRPVFVRVEENVPLHPCIRAINVQAIIGRAGKHIVDKVYNRTGTAPSSEIHNIIIANGNTEEVA